MNASEVASYSTKLKGIPVVYSVREVATMVAVSPAIVSRWISSGRLEAIPF